MCEPRRVSLGTSMAIEKLILSQKHCEQHSSPEKQYLCLAFISFHLGQDTRGPLVEQEPFIAPEFTPGLVVFVVLDL